MAGLSSRDSGLIGLCFSLGTGLFKSSPEDSNVQPGVRITDLEEVFQAEGKEIRGKKNKEGYNWFEL